jgi:DNA gyrase/topoisomerase IV subunit B
MPPLYRVQEKGRFTYLLDDEVYDQYIAERACRLLSVRRPGSKKDASPAELRATLGRARSYLEAIGKVSGERALPVPLLEILANGLGDETALRDGIRELYPGLRASGRGTSLKIEGTSGGHYYSISLDEGMRSDLGAISSLAEGLGAWSTVLVGERGAEPEEYYPAEGLGIVLARATPKQRTRLKGLGESDAKELWETTMCPETRSMVRISAGDMEGAAGAIDVLMGKRVELRRELLDRARVSMDALDI